MKKLLAFLLLLCASNAVAQMSFYAMNAPQGPRHPDWAQFIKNVAPNIDGVALFCPWWKFETSPGHFDPTYCDGAFRNFPPNLKHVIVFDLIGDYAGNAVPRFYRNKFQSVSCSAGGGAAATDWFPVLWTSEWQEYSKKAIAAFLDHVSKLPNVAYVRIGFTQFGQTFAPCVPELRQIAGTANDYKSLFAKAYRAQVEYEASLKPTVKIQEAVACSQGDCADYADVEAQIDASNGIGIGSGGLQLSDMVNAKNGKPCASDWCKLFAQYPDTPVRMLQSLTQSCVTNDCQTGSLTNLIPFAAQNHATSFELYWPDTKCAFFTGYSDETGCPMGSAPYLPYQNAIRAARGK